MPITYLTDHAAHEAAIAAWLGTYSGLGAAKVRHLNQPMQRPPKPYATYQVIVDGAAESLPVEHEEYDGVNERIERLTMIPMRMTVQVAVYGDSARAVMVRALSALRLSVVADAFRAAGLTLRAHAAIGAPDSELAGRWERRALADLEFSYIAATAEKPDDVDEGGIEWIETVTIPTEENENLTIQGIGA